MNAVKELILDKIEYLETLSEPVLQEVLDFVSFLEWRLHTTNQHLTASSDSVDINLEKDTSSFLLGVAASFSNGLSNEDLERLPTDGAENHDRYLYNNQV